HRKVPWWRHDGEPDGHLGCTVNAVERNRAFGVIVSKVDRFGYFRVALLKYLAALRAHYFDQLGTAALHHLTGAVQNLSAPLRAQCAPVGTRSNGGVNN